MPDSSTILLVDDEDSVQKLLAYPLERDGFRVVQARDGEEALARFAGERVDLVVLDLMLPKVDGLEVCKRLRAPSSGADHHAHRPRRRARQGARPRARRGRLHHEAVLDPRVPQPGARACCAARPFRSAAQDGEAIIERDGLRIDLGRRDVEVRGGGSCSSRTSSSSCCARWPPARAASSRARCSCRRSGAVPTTASRARSTFTCGTCARSSSRIPANRSYILTVRGVGYRFRAVRGCFRSVGVQLSLALLLVVAVALGIVYLSVVPSLRDRADQHPRRPDGADRRERSAAGRRCDAVQPGVRRDGVGGERRRPGRADGAARAAGRGQPLPVLG